VFGSETKAKTVNPITVLLQFEGDYSDVSIAEMGRELNSIMKDAGVRFDFKQLKDVGSNESFSDLVVVKFRGKCQMEAMPPYLYDERGPLAFTHTSDGVVLPFSEVACDRVRESVTSAMWANDHNRDRADVLLGRALGRVVAHEMYHFVANTHKHGSKGVARTSLTGGQLIADRLELESRDAQKLRH
jgi:hypothetical protein